MQMRLYAWMGKVKVPHSKACGFSTSLSTGIGVPSLLFFQVRTVVFALTPGVSASSTPLGLKPIDSHPGSNKSAKAEKNIFSMFFIGPHFFRFIKAASRNYASVFAINKAFT